MFHQLSAIPFDFSNRRRPGCRRSAGRGIGCIVYVAAVIALAAAGCSPRSESQNGQRNDLDAMEKAIINIGAQSFEVWLAISDDERELGLMQVTEGELAPISQGDGQPAVERGMLFLFEQEMPLSFWMYNTITPLDIAYIAPDGRIVKTYTMAPLETRIYPSIEPAQFALEVRAGLLAELNIAAGAYVEIPESVLKRVD